MNQIKSVVRNLGLTTVNLLNVGTVLLATSTEVLVDISGGTATTIKATPGFVKEVVLTPLTATAAYISEDTGVDYDTAEKALLDSLPNTATEAYKLTVIKSSRLLAEMMKEES